MRSSPLVLSAQRKVHKPKEVTMSTQSQPSIVFVHGIWADGSSFSKVIPALLALLLAGAVLALTHPAPSSRMDVLPRPVAGTLRPGNVR